MQSHFFFQIQLFWELRLQKIFQQFSWVHHLSSKNNRECIYQPKLGLEFQSLIFNLRIQFSTWGFTLELRASIFQLEDFLQFFNLRIFWTWGFALELWASILNVMIQFWIWGFDLELQAWIFELEDSILNLKIRSWTPGSYF